MPNADMWLMKPVQEGLCTWRDLTDGKVSLLQMAGFHELLDAQAWAEATLQARINNK